MFHQRYVDRIIPSRQFDEPSLLPFAHREFGPRPTDGRAGLPDLLKSIVVHDFTIVEIAFGLSNLVQVLKGKMAGQSR